MKALIVCCIIGLFVTCDSCHVASAQGTGGAAVFEKTCYGCHNIGGGDKTGPDLKDLTKRRQRDWILRFVKSPQAMKAGGDPAAIALFSKSAPTVMPDQTLSDSDINQIIDFIEQVSSSGQPFTPAGGKMKREPTRQDTLAGELLFTGERKLSEGGPACISCHSVQGVGQLGGGALGPDLTQVNQKYSDVELAGILKSPAFPTMSKVFANHPLTDDEVIQLFGFFRSVKAWTPIPNRDDARFLLTGAIGAMMLLGLMNFTWRGRLHGVRKNLLRETQP